MLLCGVYGDGEAAETVSGLIWPSPEQWLHFLRLKWVRTKGGKWFEWSR